MEIFLDSANISEIKAALESGCIDGVTTNPTLVAQSGKNFENNIFEIANLMEGRNAKWIVSAEVTEVENTASMVAQGISLAKLHKNIVVKLPATRGGITAGHELVKKNIRTNITLCFSVNQALLAAKSGASYVSPFLGRLDDIGEKGVSLIKRIKTAYDNYSLTTKVLAASIRSPLHVEEVAVIGADAATVPFKVFEKMFDHPLTDNGMLRFKNDWESATLQTQLNRIS